MLENLELTLFSLTTAIYAVAWAWHLRGWKLGLSRADPGRDSHPVGGLGAAFSDGWLALLVIGAFLLFALKRSNQMLGGYLCRVGQLLVPGAKEGREARIV